MVASTEVGYTQSSNSAPRNIPNRNGYTGPPRDMFKVALAITVKNKQINKLQIIQVLIESRKEKKGKVTQ